MTINNIDNIFYDAEMSVKELIEYLKENYDENNRVTWFMQKTLLNRDFYKIYIDTDDYYTEEEEERRK